VSDRELTQLHDAGVRGVRINLASETEGLTLADGERLAPRLKAMGWHLQFYMDLPKMPEAAAKLAQLKLPIVIDHFARCPAAAGVAAPAFQALLALVRHEHVWAKAMGPYFLSKQVPLYPDVTPLARALVAAAPDRVVWGSDWPHINYFEEKDMPDDGDLSNLLLRWLPTEQERLQVLVTNPANLYDFEVERDA
jgi:predicted TIM-barrel fold metal-dependent hydrolase